MQLSARFFNTLVFVRISSIWYTKYFIQQLTLLFHNIQKLCPFIKNYTHNSVLKLDYLFFETPCIYIYIYIFVKFINYSSVKLSIKTLPL